MNRIITYTLIGCSAIVMMLSGCTKDPKKPGRTFIPDMQYSNALETYAGSQSPTRNIKADTMTARLPVRGSIPRGIIPMDEKVRSDEKYLMSYTLGNHRDESPEKYPEYYENAGLNLENPVMLTKEHVDEASKLYTIYCVMCHGTKGAGDGQIVVLPNGDDGPYTAIPPSYESRLPTINDGKMFYSISYGKGMMGGYGSQLSVEQRWKMVHYIKGLVNPYTNADYAAAEQGANDSDEMDGEEAIDDNEGSQDAGESQARL